MKLKTKYIVFNDFLNTNNIKKLINSNLFYIYHQY
jgi:hypothetical protein